MGKIFPLRKNMLRIFLQFRYASNSSEIISKNIIMWLLILIRKQTSEL